MPGFTGLADRSVITLTGPDRVSFLDRLITNSVPTSGLAYAALLTPQGRVLTDLFLQPEADRRDIRLCVAHRKARSRPPAD